MPERVFSVGELNEYAKRILSGDPVMNDLTVAGEISGYKHHYASGHRYFQLKDSQAVVSCVMFRFDAQRLTFEPADGMKVRIHGSATVFPRDGRFQVYVDHMQKQGIGDLYQRFEELKEALRKEGLFEPSAKKAIPVYPKTIGIVTSKDGAALRDMVRIARRRDPGIRIILAPCAVQGPSAAAEIARAIERLNEDGRADVILCGRGGGSMEDLWCFNEEVVARAIYASGIPVISCVGHETDTTIADFTADRRAATPSMAAEIAVPVVAELKDELNKLSGRVAFALKQGNLVRKARLETILARQAFRAPSRIMIDERREIIDRTIDQCERAYGEMIRRSGTRLEQAAVRLRALDPSGVLERGYACVYRDGHIVTEAAGLDKDTELAVRFHDASIAVKTIDVPKKG